MASVTYDVQWREAITEVADQLETEFSEDPAFRPKDLTDYSSLYIKYLQLYKKLEECYDLVVHPQKRESIKRALEAVIGRLIEIKNWLTKLNNNNDMVVFDDNLVNLKLPPDVLQIPPPRYFRDDRKQDLEDRNKILETLTAKYDIDKGGRKQSKQLKLPPLALVDAVRAIQRTERCRVAKKVGLAAKKKQMEREYERNLLHMEDLSDSDAATRIQKVVRMMIAIRKAKKVAHEEGIFLGMEDRRTKKDKSPIFKLRATCVERKKKQAEYRGDFDAELINVRDKVSETEGPEIRETIQDKINDWFLENRDPNTGDYPDFPEEEDGGSKSILFPTPQVVYPPGYVPEESSKDVGKKDSKESSGKEKGKSKGEKAPESTESELDLAPTNEFVKGLKEAVSEYDSVWRFRDESRRFGEKFDDNLFRETVRPLVYDAIRKEVDEEMKVVLQNLKDMLIAERAGKGGKKGKKGGKGKKGKKGKKGGKGKGKKSKDPTAERSIESLFAELVRNKIIKHCPERHMGEYLCTYSPTRIQQQTGTAILPSMQQVRQLLSEICILPLGSQAVHQKVPLTKSVLIYGPPMTGKTLLSHIATHAAGANLFDLSPRNTDGSYPGKSSALMVHMVFKVAKVMAPSVIYIDEIEKVFITDKKKAKEFGGTEPFSRIKKELLKELKQLKAGDQVLIICNSSIPYLAISKDCKAMLNFIDKFLRLPLPDYGSRQFILKSLLDKAGAWKNCKVDLSLIARISERISPGVIKAMLERLLTHRRLAQLEKRPVTTEEIIQAMAKYDMVEEDTLEAFEYEKQNWTLKLPHLQPPEPLGAPKNSMAKKKGGSGSKKK